MVHDACSRGNRVVDASQFQKQLSELTDAEKMATFAFPVEHYEIDLMATGPLPADRPCSEAPPTYPPPLMKERWPQDMAELGQLIGDADRLDTVVKELIGNYRRSLDALHRALTAAKAPSRDGVLAFEQFEQNAADAFAAGIGRSRPLA